MNDSQTRRAQTMAVDLVLQSAPSTLSCASSFRRLFPFLLAGVVAVGCAAPLENTEFEEGVITLERHQRELQGRLEKIEKLGDGPLRANAEMRAKLEALTAEVRNLNGKMDEQKNQMTSLNRRVDDQSFALKSLQGSMAAPGGAVAPPAPADQNADSAPADGATRAPINDRVVLPGKSVGQTPSTTPTELYNLAYNDYAKGNDDLAISGFTRFVQQFPASALAPNALYWTGEIYYSRRAYPKAIIYFEQVHQKYPKSEKAAAGLLKSGYAHLELGNQPRAELYLKKVIERFPQSNEASLAKDKLAGLN